MSRKLLQATNVVLALITIIIAGASFISGINSPIYGSDVIPPIPSLDSNLRFMGGLGLGLGFALLWITPNNRKTGTVIQVDLDLCITRWNWAIDINGGDWISTCAIGYLYHHRSSWRSFIDLLAKSNRQREHTKLGIESV
jgi:hypothetical protein